MRSLVAAVAVVLLGATLALAQKTSFVLDNAVDFSQFRIHARGETTEVDTQAMAEKRDRTITAAVKILQSVPAKKKA